MSSNSPLSRRKFLGTLGTGALTLFLSGERNNKNPSNGLLLGACDSADGRHFMAGFDGAGHRQFMLAVPQRMHGIAFNPIHPEQSVFFARRPGTEIYGIDLESGTIEHKQASPPGRHFCGHGCFSADGRYLYASENDYIRNQGVISVRDAVTLQVLEEWRSGGPDPHEIRLLDKDRTLAVANGGILTHPARPGINLAPDAMQPSLVYLDTANGKMRGEFRLHDRQLSIRHIDINDKGLVAIALQYEGNKESSMPLLASHAGEDALQLFTAEACDWRRMNHYTGSVKFADNDATIAVSSPRGNCFGVWNIVKQEMLAQHYIHDVCGIGYDRQFRNFVVTTGAGVIYRFDIAGNAVDKPTNLPDVRWDNHLLAIS
jgi:uncharacterized protein